MRTFKNWVDTETSSTRDIAEYFADKYNLGSYELHYGELKHMTYVFELGDVIVEHQYDNIYNITIYNEQDRKEMSGDDVECDDRNWGGE